MTPHISVLLPVWNAASTLPACLRSIARQSQTDFECVLVDDGSTDDSLAMARAFAARDPRFRVVAGPHRGLVETLQSGISECRGEIVVRMDADDLMHRHRIALQCAALRARPQLSALGCHVRLFPRRALGTGYREYERWLNQIDGEARIRSERFIECPIAHPALAIRSAVLQKFGYRDCGWAEDYDLVLRLLEAGERIDVVPRRLLLWRHRPDRLSRTHPHYAIERFVACKAHFLSRSFLAQTHDYVLWGYGGTGRQLYRALADCGKRPRFIVELHPGRLGQTIHGAPVIAPEELREIDEFPIVASVAGEDARAKIRGALAELGRVEVRDFVLAA